MIAGVQTKPLRLIPDERGFLMEILRTDDALFDRFGQLYLTYAYPDVVKGWHYHKIQTDFFCCVKGMIKLVLFDGRDGSATKGEVNEFFLGDQNRLLVSIPPFVLHGFKGLPPEGGYLINAPTHLYVYDSPDEYRVPPHDNDVPYDWARKDG
jgi:dTDP-4-dehydrorhamnose 3,5-epimerase